MIGIKDFLGQIENCDAEIERISTLKRNLQTDGYKDYELIRATVKYFTILESSQKDLVVFFEMPEEFIDDCAFVKSYSMKRFSHLIVVHQKEDMSVEVANQIVHSNLLDEPFLNEYRFISKDKVIVREFYKDKFSRNLNHYYLLRLDSTKKDFVEKSKLTLKEYFDLYQRSYGSLEELNQGPKINLAIERD